MGKNNAVKKATSAKSWKGKMKVEGAPLDLPSDNTALVRQISPQAFLTSGMIPDPLRPLIQQAINSKKGLPPAKAKQIMEDPKLVSGAMEMFDRVVCYVVIEPEIVMPPTCEVEDGEGVACGEYATIEAHTRTSEKFSHKYVEGPRDHDVLYADEVDMTDKQFIFQWALAGTRELEPFRDELAATVGSLSDGEVVPAAAV